MSGEIDLTFTDELTPADEKEQKKQKKIVEKLAAEVPVLTKPKVKEKEKQFNLGMLPVSVIKEITRVAKQNGENRRTYILKAIKDRGVDIPEDLLRDRREIELE